MSAKYLDQLTWDLGRAYYAYVGMIERVLVAAELDHLLRPGMGHVLFTLYEQDDLSIKEIAIRSHLAPSTLTGLLKQMGKAGVVSRHRDRTDGRLVRIRLTSLGREIENKCRGMLRKVTRIAQEAVGKQNVPQAKCMLQGLTEAFNREEHRLARQQAATSVG
ncbi:MAG: MarR family winged helix-turn-helix transcriptional regulator [Planctomycetaceae bacterium]